MLDARKEEYEKYFLNKQDLDTTLANMAKEQRIYQKVKADSSATQREEGTSASFFSLLL